MSKKEVDVVEKPLQDSPAEGEQTTEQSKEKTLENIDQSAEPIENIQGHAEQSEGAEQIKDTEQANMVLQDQADTVLQDQADTGLQDLSVPEQSREAYLERELEREREARRLSEARLVCLDLLDSEGLPRELGDYLTVSDEGETRKRVKDVSKIIKKAINEAVSARLETIKSPRQGKRPMTRADFKGLSLADMQRLYVTDKELYKQLIKG